jgi:hypothetical protein
MVNVPDHSVDGQLKESVKKLEGDWKLKGPVMVKALARQPQVGAVLLVTPIQ